MNFGDGISQEILVFLSIQLIAVKIKNSANSSYFYTYAKIYLL